MSGSRTGYLYSEFTRGTRTDTQSCGVFGLLLIIVLTN